MKKQYTLFVDESGDAGLENVQSGTRLKGPTQCLTLGAALIANDEREAIEQERQALIDLFNKQKSNALHASELSHFQKIHYAQRMLKFDVRFFGVISCKKTLNGYKSKIDSNPKYYYNKCSQYLMEGVGAHLNNQQIDKADVSIIFEKAKYDYAKMRNFLAKIQATPIHENAKNLRYVNVSAIDTRTKKEERLLEVADLVAHALFKCVDKHPKHYGISEARYLKELAPRFFGHPTTGRLIGGGLHFVKGADQVGLDFETMKMVSNLTAAV